MLKGLLGNKGSRANKMNNSIIHAKVIALWSLVHGLSSVVTVKGVVDTNHLEDEVELILNSINV